MEVIERKVDPGDVLLIPGDIHCDKEDWPAIKVMLKVAAAAGVNRACMVGDSTESAGISRHPSMRARKNFKFSKGTIKSEKKHLEPVVAGLEALGLKSADLLTGNHEKWWELVQEAFPGFDDTEWWELYGDVFNNWDVRAEYVAIKYGPLLVCHGHRLRGALAKYSAASVLANYPGQSTAYGHTHRIDAATTPTFKYGQRVAHGAFTLGHLKRRDLELREEIGAFSERHQQGFGLVFFTDLGNKEIGYHIDLCRIDRDSKDRPFVVWGGEVFK